MFKPKENLGKPELINMSIIWELSSCACQGPEGISLAPTRAWGQLRAWAASLHKGCGGTHGEDLS